MPTERFEMRLGLTAGYSGANMALPMDLILEAERLGFDSVWTAEAYGSDAVSPVAWILAQTTRIRAGTAIMQMSARTPACTASTAMTLHGMSGGRFILGIGASGAQVVEGWHGVEYGRPITRTREFISIVRKILAREKALEHKGHHYEIPYAGEGASGLAKPLKSILHGDPSMPIYTASITPAGLRCSAELADGVFPIFLNPERYEVIGAHLEEGFAVAEGSKGLDDFDVAVQVPLVMGDDLDKCRNVVKSFLALYIGGMGARNKNFYNDYASRLGFEGPAAEIQDLFLSGKRPEAIAAVPDSLVDAVGLVGPADRIRDRLQVWKEAGQRKQVGTMILGGAQVEAFRLVAEEVL